MYRESNSHIAWAMQTTCSYSPCNQYITITPSKLPQDVIIVSMKMYKLSTSLPSWTHSDGIFGSTVLEWVKVFVFCSSIQMHPWNVRWEATKKNSNLKAQVENGNDNSFAPKESNSAREQVHKKNRIFSNNNTNTLTGMAANMTRPTFVRPTWRKIQLTLITIT